MADITMCVNTLCPNASTCYRSTAKPSEHWQSMAMFEYTIGADGVHCDNYLQNYISETKPVKTQENEMKLPKLYAPVTISFWSLRNGVGAGLGVIFDIDTLVTRKCRRVLCADGWKWQLVHYIMDNDWDWGLENDKEILDNYGSELEFEIA